MHRLCSASKLFCCAATTFFLISSTRPVASSSSSFLVRKASYLSPSLFLSLPSLFSCVAAFSSMLYSSTYLFALSLPLFVHVIFFSFTSASTTLWSAETSIHFPLGFACSQACTELCPPLLPAGCFLLVFVELYRSPLIHLSFFSVMAFFQNRCCFLNAGSFFFSCRASMKTTGTPCAWFLGRKGPRLPMSQIIHQCSVLHHHLHQKRKVCVSLSLRHPFISLSIPLSLCVL